MNVFNEKNKVTRTVKEKKDIIHFYNEYAKSWDERFTKNKSSVHFLNKRLDIIRNLADFSGNDRVLELGCGTAFHLASLSPYFKYGVGIDISEEMLLIAKEKISNSGTPEKLAFVCDDAETLQSVSSNSFDVVFFVGLIEHLPNPEKCLKSCRRVLKWGGKLLGLTPNRYSPWYSLIGPIVRRSVKHLSTDKYYSKKELHYMLLKTGFKNCSFKLWGFIPAGDFPDFTLGILKFIEKIAEKTIVKNLAGGIAFKAEK